MTRKILHLDLDAFFCAVEELHDPSLKGKPFAVGGKADQRGVVASCSYAARMYGVRSAMPMSRAQKLCPKLIVISSHHGNYSAVSKNVMALINISPFIEKISIDEAFIDATGLPEPLEEIAQDLQHRVNTQMNLPISIGGASNKLVAKIANDWGKSQKKGVEPPNTITIIQPGEEADFLAPLPVQFLWGIGPKTAGKLAGVGINTAGELAQTPPETLKMLFGQYGPDLRLRALGVDNSPIQLEHEIKSVSNEVTFAKDIKDEDKLRQVLIQLSEQVGRRLRKSALSGTTIHIKLRWSDFSTITRQRTLPTSTNLDNEIYQTAYSLFVENWPRGKPVRLIGVGISGLGPPIYQLELWGNEHQKKADLSDAVDQLRDRFGRDIIKRAKEIKKQNRDDKQEKI